MHQHKLFLILPRLLKVSTIRSKGRVDFRYVSFYRVNVCTVYDLFSSSKRGIILGESNFTMMSCHFLKYDLMDIFLKKCFYRLRLQLIILMKNGYLLNVINLNH